MLPLTRGFLLRIMGSIRAFVRFGSKFILKMFVVLTASHSILLAIDSTSPDRILRIVCRLFYFRTGTKWGSYVVLSENTMMDGATIGLYAGEFKLCQLRSP